MFEYSLGVLCSKIYIRRRYRQSYICYMWPSSRQPSAKVNRIELWVRLYAAIVYTHHHHLFTTQLILIYPRRVEGRVNTAERVCSTSPRLCKAMALVINTTATATVGYYLQTSRPAVRHVTSRRHPLVVPLSVAASSCLYETTQPYIWEPSQLRQLHALQVDRLTAGQHWTHTHA